MCVRNEDRYRIPFKGLKEGEHIFDFEVDSSFFENYERSEIKEGSLHVRVALLKSSRLLTLDFDIRGSVRIPCDRCLDEFDMPITFRDTLYVKLGDRYSEESANTVIIPEEDASFVISQYIYEYAHLALPLRRVHPDDEHGHSTCNPLMIKKLEELSVPTGNEEDTGIDQRWSALKDFFKNAN